MARAAGAGDAARRYHHGDLRRVLLEAAVEAIDEAGPAALSLRDLARRAGVSHAAPAHHFGDKAGLLTAVAADGFRRLAATLGDAYRATGSFLEVGVAYARFAVAHRAHFEVMFRPELYRADDPELVQARDAARSLLYPPAAEAADGSGGDDLRAAVAAWSLVHGLVTLWLNGNLPPQLGDDPGQLVRDVARYLF
ncbi:MAG TPA: TetR/AcrR family transcriptional regulator [Actinomycetota bacterium]|jgi:AcrR family transcriptional regulator|nr:TetR/AcrR family transcriptional regulator [Actinomycetota bacterium]